jgi:hypothetical protein
MEARDETKSVAKAASERPDLLLMVIRLALLDGYSMKPRMMRSNRIGL